MKTQIQIIVNKVIIMAILFCLTPNFKQIQAQDNPFIYFKDGVFKYQCDTIYPMVMNYGFLIIKTTDGNYHATPDNRYCKEEMCNNNTQFSCGKNPLQWKEEMIEQFQKIASLKFNMIRICGLTEFCYNYNAINPSLKSWNYYIQQANDTHCYWFTQGFEVDETEFYIFGDLLQQVIDALNESGTDLKLIILLGGHNVEIISYQYSQYLDYMSQRFRNEPRIFAYDLYNEPIWYTNNFIPLDKTVTFQICNDWYHSIKHNAPAHFVTMGCEIGDIMHWDPQILPLDFISFHHYAYLREDEYFDSDAPLQRFKTWFKWLSNTITKPYIIGETGIHGIDPEDVIGITLPEIVATRAEQAKYAQFTLNYSKWFNTLGYSWFNYKDVYPHDPNIPFTEQNFFGIVFNDKKTNLDIETAKPQAESVFNNFDPSSSECKEIGGVNCTQPQSEYFHPVPDYYLNNQLLSGYIYDENGIGIPNVYIEASINDGKAKYVTSWAITDKDGHYVIYYLWPKPYAFVDLMRITYPGKDLLEVDLNYNSNTEYNGTLLNLPPLPTIPSQEYYTLASNTQEIWDSQRYLPFKEITVKDGAVLTITADVFLDENAKIIVERKGKLVVDGGRITCSCGQWKGVEVWGDPTQLSTGDYQGMVVVKNEGIIEHAIVGIRNVKVVENGGDGLIDLAFAGGIIQTTGANFINNKEAIRFFKYPAIGYTHQHKSFINATHFETNENYPGSVHPGYFVSLSEVNKVSFTGCEFINGTLQKSFQTGGIYSINSQFSVEGVLNGNTWNNGLFQNMYYGIYAMTSNPNRFADIRHTDFDLNFRGLYISGMTTARVTSNRFIIDEPFITNGGYGMYLNSSTGYHVEDNDYLHEGHIQNGVGLIVNESGIASNLIYRNRFTNLNAGMNIQGKNRAKNGVGLQLKCNDYTRTLMDKIIIWNAPIMNQEAGIATSQGAPSSTPEAMAGNLFQNDGPPNNDDDDILNEANHVTYYYPSNTDDDDVIPVDFTENTVTPDDQFIQPEDWTYEDGCPPDKTIGGGGTGGTIGKMAVAEQKADSVETILATLIDGGNTEQVQTEVETSLPPETMQVYSELMNKSPYLSDTVVSTAIEKEDVLPGAMIRDIMVANPNTAKSEALMNKLDERWDPLPEYMRAQILAGRSIVSIREETEAKLAAYKLEKEKYFNELIRYYLNDTLNPETSTDSLTGLLQSENDLNAKYQLAMLSMEKGAWSQGLAILNNIPDQFELTSSEADAHFQFIFYYSLLSGMAEQGQSITEGDSAQIVALFTIAENQKGIEAVYARNLLLDLNQLEYEEPIILPDMLKSTTAQDEYNVLMGKASEAPGYIRVQPNPATDYIIIEHKVEDYAAATIGITDISGNIKYSVNKNNQKDQITVDTRDWKPGIYIATLKINGKLVESVKFTIID